MVDQNATVFVTPTLERLKLLSHTLAILRSPHNSHTCLSFFLLSLRLKDQFGQNPYYTIDPL